MTGTVYTETVVHVAPTQFLNEAPYQVAIVSLDAGGRLTARITGDRVTIGDRVELAEERDQVSYYRKINA
jgi:uncharacterized OB-fold protein